MFAYNAVGTFDNNSNYDGEDDDAIDPGTDIPDENGEEEGAQDEEESKDV